METVLKAFTTHLSLGANQDMYRYRAAFNLLWGFDLLISRWIGISLKLREIHYLKSNNKTK